MAKNNIIRPNTYKHKQEFISNPAFYNNRGVILWKQGNYKAAIADLEYSLSLNSNDVNTYYNLANIYLQQKKYSEAIAYFFKCLEKDFSFSLAKSQLENLIQVEYTTLDRPQRECAAFDLNKRGMEYLEQGSHDLAFLCFNLALTLHADPDYYINCAYIYRVLGNFQAVSTISAKAANSGFYAKAAFINNNFGINAAIPLAANPEQEVKILVKIMNKWGAELSKIGNYELARICLNKSISLSETGYAYTERGFVHKKLEMYDLAINDYLKALEFNMNDEAASITYGMLGSAYDVKCDFGPALYNYVYALTLNPNNQVAHSKLKRFLDLNEPQPILALIKTLPDKQQELLLDECRHKDSLLGAHIRKSERASKKINTSFQKHILKEVCDQLNDINPEYVNPKSAKTISKLGLFKQPVNVVVNSQEQTQSHKRVFSS